MVIRQIGETRRRVVALAGPIVIPVYNSPGHFMEIASGETVDVVEHSRFDKNVYGEVGWVLRGYEEVVTPPTHQEGPYR